MLNAIFDFPPKIDFFHMNSKSTMQISHGTFRRPYNMNTFLWLIACGFWIVACCLYLVACNLSLITCGRVLRTNPCLI